MGLDQQDHVKWSTNSAMWRRPTTSQGADKLRAPFKRSNQRGTTLNDRADVRANLGQQGGHLADRRHSAQSTPDRGDANRGPRTAAWDASLLGRGQTRKRSPSDTPTGSSALQGAEQTRGRAHEVSQLVWPIAGTRPSRHQTGATRTGDRGLLRRTLAARPRSDTQKEPSRQACWPRSGRLSPGRTDRGLVSDGLRTKPTRSTHPPFTTSEGISSVEDVIHHYVPDPVFQG